MGSLEKLVRILKIAPETVPFPLAKKRKFRPCHAKRKYMDGKGALTALKCGDNEIPDFIEDIIGHGKATARIAAAMDHQ